MNTPEFWMGTALAVLSFLLGSIPFGLLLGRMAGQDVRREGSGNIGATNVWRVCGWRFGAAAFALDAAKGAAPILLMVPWFCGSPPGPMDAAGHGVDGVLPASMSAGSSPLLWAAMETLAGFMAVAGHCFSPWLKFRGGKGVAAAAGATACLMPWAFGAGLLTFAAVLAATRFVSAGSLMAVAALAAAAVFWRPGWRPETAPYLYFACLLCLLVWWTHRANIRRLLSGAELPVGRRKP